MLFHPIRVKINILKNNLAKIRGVLDTQIFYAEICALVSFDIVCRSGFKKGANRDVAILVVVAVSGLESVSIK